MTGVSVDVEGNIKVVAFVPLDSRPRTSSFSLFLYVFKPSILTIYSTLPIRRGRLCFDADGVKDKGKSEGNTLFYWIARNKPGNDGGFS